MAAAASAQPIALPSNSNGNQHDITMNPGSFGAQSGSFNAGSYARRFINSPISLRAGSFGSRFYPGVSPGQLMGPLECVPLHLPGNVDVDLILPFAALTISDLASWLRRSKVIVVRQS